MNRITEEQYQFALERVEELLPLVKEDTPLNDKHAIELTMMSDIVIAYVNRNYGGAYKSLQAAKRKKKKIINICDFLS